MTVAEATNVGALGFLTVLEHEHLGLVGGYLILNTAGRPLEFHCTAPVKPNRARADPVWAHARRLPVR